MKLENKTRNIINEIIYYSFYFTLFFIAIRIVHKQIMFGGDYREHIDYINMIFYEKYYVPHPGFHIITFFLSKITSLHYLQVVPILNAFAIVCAIKVTELIIQRSIQNPLNKISCLFLSIIINIVIAIYVPFFNSNMYLGQWSPNTWHSPTMTLIKPFALLSFYLLLLYFKDITSTNRNYYLFFASLLLCIGTVIKPIFIICLIPAIYLYLLLFWTKQYKVISSIFFVLVPSIIVIIIQYLLTYIFEWHNSSFHDKVVFTWFGVMKMYSPNIFISLLLVAAFPIGVLLFSYKKIRNTVPLTLAWILAIISYLLSGLLEEKIKYWGANFISCFEICLYVLFVFSFIEYINWYTNTKNNKAKIIVVGSILALHLCSGLIYLYYMLKFGSDAYKVF